MKFRSKPRVVEAEQFWPEVKPWPKGVDYDVCGGVPCHPHVHTMHGGQGVPVEAGDWIVAEPDGEHYYPVQADVFAATYEPVKE